MKLSDLLFTQRQHTYNDLEKIRSDINMSMGMHYGAAFFAALILFIFRTKLPFPFPLFFFVVCGFLVASIAIHCMSLRKKWVRLCYSIITYLDSGVAPFIFYCTGGFLSPFVLTHVITMVGSGIIYSQNKRLLRDSFLIIIGSYTAIALLQKYGLIHNPVSYADNMMQSDLFFYFVFLLTFFIISSGYLLLIQLQKNEHDLVDKISNAFNSVVEGTASAVGQDFFKQLCSHLAKTLKVRSVFIGELSNKNEVLTILASIKDDVQTDIKPFIISNTIFAETLHAKRYILSSEAITQYGDSPLLHECNARFFFGQTLYNNQQEPIGVLCVINDKPAENMELVEQLVKVFASRAAAEISRKQSEEKQQELHAQLAQAQKMHALGHLAGGIAHDFNNILFAISGYASLLNNKLNDEELINRYVKPINAAGMRASDLIKRVLSFSRGSSTNLPAAVEVHRVVLDVISLLERSVDKRIRIFTAFNADNSVTLGDTTLLQNVLLNLGTNACDAMAKNGGSITISTGSAMLEANGTLCQIFKIPAREYLTVSVSDTGCGMSKETMLHMFEPFFTTKPKSKGTGLGLTNVWGYIESYKGAISVISEPDKGSAFTLYLPYVDIASIERLEEVRKPKRIKERVAGKNIMVVDDESDVREIIYEILTSNGYTVTMFDNGHKAIEAVKNGPVKFDCVVLDMIMPQISGFDTFFEIRKIKPTQKVIIISGFSQEAQIQKILSEADTSFIRKPFDEERFLVEIEDMIFY